MNSNKNINKKIILTLGAMVVTSVPLITTISCSKDEISSNGVIEEKVTTISCSKDEISSNGVIEEKVTTISCSKDDISSNGVIEAKDKLNNRKITRKLVGPKGSEKWITKLKEQNFIRFFADGEFVHNSNAIFQRSPRTILHGSPIVQGVIKNNGVSVEIPEEYLGTIDTSNLNPKFFGMTKLETFVKENNGILKLSIIEGTEDDTTGTLGVKAIMIFDNKEKVEAEYLVDGFAITKDIEMNGDEFTSITSIINALNKKTNLDFEKKVSIMTPQDLKNELVELYDKTHGGRLTIIGTYNGKVSAVALDRNDMLINLINAFGDVSQTKRYDGTWRKLGWSILSQPGEVQAGSLVKLFHEYSNDLPNDEDKDAVAGLLGNLPAGVMNMFPSLLKLFSQVADGVKTMPMVNEWAKNTHDNTTITKENPLGNTYEEKIKDLNHILVRWVLKTGNWK